MTKNGKCGPIKSPMKPPKHDKTVKGPMAPVMKPKKGK